ncbi:arylsulfatase [Chitinophaga jiangningensis]|uniref:Arylsulfatase n=1 Tax=Chitinophaga jiangningensis TaxID=1419482 RepID=A0A1M7BZR5_9BACT|nr:arylsulfatase [Chitinophaga jiangningensis]SHL60470.1 arylsulfatase [Chitinophaga jiangningensis]
MLIFSKQLRAIAAIALLGALTSSSAQAQKKPNILVIFGDDIGIPQISAYTKGLMGYQTPNIDRIANEGMLFTDSYGQQSCTAGRASFILGEEPFRTGLLTIGMPGDPHGITEWMPTIADVMKNAGYATGQFGKNHLGDQDKHLPTKHGFDEFFGNLYHLNAEEEPEGYFYPKDPSFKKRFGPRGVIRSSADGKIEDTGPLTSKRMETVDEEFLGAAKEFINKQAKADKPFFVWFNSTRMHVFTHLKPASLGKTGVGIHADGMVEHDGMVGELLNLLDNLKIADNTIVLYTTDNGAEIALWPDGAMTMFHGEKGTTWEGGMRIPMMIRWPGKIKPGTVSNEIISLIDWFPTLCAAAGVSDIKGKMASGYSANGKNFKVHLDGFDFLPYLTGQTQKGPREVIYYFDQGGNLNAVRWKDWKTSFAVASEGNIATATREVTSWATITNLRMDPYERGMKEGGGSTRFLGQQMWLLVPIQQTIKEFFKDFDKYPYQEGSSLNPSGINYGFLRQQDAMKRLKEMENMTTR